MTHVNPVEGVEEVVSSTTIFDLPFDDVIVTHIAVYLENYHLLAMWKASHGCRAFRDLVEGMIGARRDLGITPFAKSDELSLCPIAAARSCRKLRSISLYNFSEKPSCVGSLTELLANNPLISKIYLSSVDWNLFLEALSKSNILLRDVFMFYIRNVTKESLAAFFSKQPFLRRIGLRLLFTNLEPTLFAIGRTCHELEELSLCDCGKIENDDLFREIAENCPKLRSLTLPPIPGYKLRHTPHGNQIVIPMPETNIFDLFDFEDFENEDDEESSGNEF